MGTQPKNTHGIQTQTQPNPYTNFGSGLGINLGYPNFGYPIPALIAKDCAPHGNQHGNSSLIFRGQSLTTIQALNVEVLLHVE